VKSSGVPAEPLDPLVAWASRRPRPSGRYPLRPRWPASGQTPDIAGVGSSASEAGGLTSGPVEQESAGLLFKLLTTSAGHVPGTLLGQRVTLIDELERRGAPTGLVTIWTGAGMRTATVVERL
jgi:hypothetical protein